LVAPGSAGSVSVIAEFDSSVGMETKPCTGGATICGLTASPPVAAGRWPRPCHCAAMTLDGYPGL
jgi:hypothetical protein